MKIKRVSIADKSVESRDNLMSSIQHECPSCNNDKFTLFGSEIILAPIGENGYAFSLNGICTKCSHINDINITGILDRVISNEERSKLIEECKEMNSL